MNKKVEELIEALEELKKIIENSAIKELGFDQQFGWNFAHIRKEDIQNIIFNTISKLKTYTFSEIPEGFELSVDYHIANINRLTQTSKTQLIANSNNMTHMQSALLLTLFTIFNDIDFELFSWENITDKKLQPRALTNRVRGLKSRLDEYDNSCKDLDQKIKLIDEAHQTAESLPVDIADLKEAKEKLELFLKEAKAELKSTHDEIMEVKDNVVEYNNQAKESLKLSLETIQEISSNAQISNNLVKECDDALQITTTQGLAAGFDQKAKQLRRSVWIWLLGLLVALTSGAWLGLEKITEFTNSINSDITTGQAVMQIIMSFLSVGGSIWLAWISTKQITQRFKLSEDYSYKATVAKAFTGFSKQAERFDPETQERLFNSTLDRIDEMPLRLLSKDDYSSPWHEFLDSEAFSKAIDMVPALAKEASKFANNTKLSFKSKKITKRKDNLVKEGKVE